ncbi:MAG: M2 family metallopeptidase [Rubricoccaceae bacterium]|nr:M2 family metallopeptidase [Rubricoccaceae bacterium]
MSRLQLTAPFVVLLLLASCGSDDNSSFSVALPDYATPEEAQVGAQAFLDEYTETLLPLYYESALAEWEANTRIVEGDTTNAARVQAANEAYAAFTGSGENIGMAQAFLEISDQLTELQVKQLEAILYEAASNPQTVPELVSQRIAAESAQNETLFGHTYVLDGEEVTTNDLDQILREPSDLEERLAAWETSKTVGPQLREGLENLQRLRNEVVGALGYDNYFAYQVSDYGMTTDEMVSLMQQLNEELLPLYREIHTYFRYELAERYGEDVPDLIPAHWLPNRWGQDWTALVNVEGANIDPALEERGAEWLVRQSEEFYRSIGFDALPESFYQRSSLYPLPEDADYKKNNHASAWHLDLQDDVRSLMSVEPNRDWYETTHHELGHIYYYISYTNDNVPPLLRGGANRAYHEAVGSLMGLASLQPRFLNEVGLGTGGASPDPIQALLKEALNYVVFIPWSAGVMTAFEHDLYANDLPSDEWNARWWELKAQYQGIAPPDASRAERGSAFNDAATKTHINNDAAQYYDYALSNVLLFQLHDHIAREILDENPRDTNYFGRTEVGDFLKSILEPGQTVDGNELLEQATGESLSANAMLDYFEPLMAWLQEQNEGREHTI